jgi:hypothetical protein
MIVLLRLAYINLGLAVIFRDAGNILQSNIHVLAAITAMLEAAKLFGVF